MVWTSSTKAKFKNWEGASGRRREGGRETDRTQNTTGITIVGLRRVACHSDGVCRGGGATGSRALSGGFRALDALGHRGFRLSSCIASCIRGIVQQGMRQRKVAMSFLTIF